MAKYFYFSTMVLFLFTSCEMVKEIDYDTVYEGDKIVVHGFISPQDGVQIIVKKTVPPNKVNADDRLEHAIIDLYEDGINVESLIVVNDYLYTTHSKFLPKVGSLYYISVEASGMPKAVSAPQTIIFPSEIDSLYIKVEELTRFGNLIVSFYDNQLYEQAYYIKPFYFIEGTINSTRSVGSEIFNPYGLIDKTVFGVNSIEYPVGHISNFDSIRVELYTLSSDLKKYLKSIQYYESSKEDPFFEQTYPVFSNISGGYGIFASYSYTYRIIVKSF